MQDSFYLKFILIDDLSFLLFLFLIAKGATTTDLPAGVLYRVKATYKYVREDADELSFEVGDTIQVIEYDDPEDQVNNKMKSISITSN